MTGDKNGITLVEILISAFLFLIAATIVASSLTMFLRTKKTSQENQILQDNLRFIFDKIREDVRFGIVDHGAYGGSLSSPTSALYLLVNNFPVVYELQGGNLIKHNGSISAGQQLNDVLLKIKTARFFISPSKDPFDLLDLSAPLAQPRVTFAIEGVALGADLTEKGQSLILQTTVSSRVYKK